MVSFHNVPVFSCLIIKRIYSIFRFKCEVVFSVGYNDDPIKMV